MSKKNEIEKREDKLPAKFNFGEDAGKGREREDGDECTIPYIVLLQSNSPQVAAGIGKAGQFYNTLTEEAFDGPFLFIPCAMDRAYVRKRADRATIGRLPADAPLVLQLLAEQGAFGKLYENVGDTENSNYLEDTRFLTGVLWGGSVPMPVCLKLKSTALNSFSTFWGVIGKLEQDMQEAGELEGKLPLFACPTVVASESDKNAKGNFCKISLTPEKGRGTEGAYKSLMSQDDVRYIAGKALHARVEKGLIVRDDDDAKADHDAY